MSYVTTVVVASSWLSDDDRQFVNEAAADQSRFGTSFSEPAHCDQKVFGGGKCAEGAFLLGAFNYLNVEDFIAALRTRKFHAGIYVLAFTNGEYVHTYMQDEERDPADVGGDFHVHDTPSKVAPR
jgi:hypothetical protein